MSTSPTGLVGANIRAEMARREVTQSMLAIALGKNQTWVSTRLRGRTPIDINDLAAIAAYLNVSASSLLQRMDIPLVPELRTA